MFTVIMFILIIVFIIWMCVAMTKAWNKGAAQRRQGAEAQSLRHGGQYVLEWDGPAAQGAADPEFGALLVEIPKRSGGEGVRFFERGVSVESKRVPYENLKDVVFIPGSDRKGFTMKQKLQNSAVLWLYRKKGSTIGIRDLTYRFDGQTITAIQKGLGFLPED